MSVEIKTNPTSNLNIDNNSASVCIDNSIQIDASIGVSNKNASIDVGANVKTGTIISASAGLENKNVYMNASYSDTTEAHITIDSKINYHGVGTSNSVDAYAKTGTELEIEASVGKNGVNINGGASSGSYVGVDASSTINLREISGTATGGVTVGEHLEIGGGATGTYNNGKINIGVSGDVAVLVGVEVDVNVEIDTKQIQKDTISVVHNISHDVTNTAKKEIDNISKASTKATKDIKKTFKKLKL